MFLVLTDAHPATMTSSFRIRLCAAMVRIFSGMDLIESQLAATLRGFFPRPPEVDAKGSDIKPFAESSVLLPKEDLDTLVAVPRRPRAEAKRFLLEAPARILLEATSGGALATRRRRSVGLLRPRREADWSGDHISFSRQSVVGKEDVYDPRAETRSLVHRSLRPNVASETLGKHAEYAEFERRQIWHCDRRAEETRENLGSAAQREPAVLRRFGEDVALTQRDRRWAEVPMWRTPEEIAEYERSLARRQRTIAQMEEEGRMTGRRKSVVRFLPWQLADTPELIHQLGISAGASLEKVAMPEPATLRRPSGADASSDAEASIG